MMSKNILLVEGRYDKEFIQYFCDHKIGANKIKVEVQTPTDFGSRNDGWRGLLDNISTPLKRLDSGSIERIGIIVDADFKGANTGGVQARYEAIVSAIQSAIEKDIPRISGYNFPKAPNLNQGEVFQHNNGLTGIGLWIMPNHRNEGMIEHFLESLISSDPQQQFLINYATATVSNLTHKLFSNNHSKKAEVNTWLAWQEKPAQTYNLLENGVFDSSKTQAFENWLKKVFP